ncbi:MAG: hypothetical protein ACK559_06010, partial [bacterium]
MATPVPFVAAVQAACAMVIPLRTATKAPSPTAVCRRVLVVRSVSLKWPESTAAAAPIPANTNVPAPKGPVITAATEAMAARMAAHPPTEATATLRAPIPTLAVAAAAAIPISAEPVVLMGSGSPEITPAMAFAAWMKGLRPAASTPPMLVPIAPR